MYLCIYIYIYIYICIYVYIGIFRNQYAVFVLPKHFVEV